MKPRRTPLESAVEPWRVFLPERLSEALTEMGWKQYQFERTAGLANGTVSHFKDYSRCPSLETLVLICKTLRRSPDWLLGLPEAEVPEGAPLNGKDEDWMKVIGPRVRWIREHRGLSVDELASLIGRSKPMMGQIENGRRGPSVDTFVKLCFALNVPGKWLLGFVSFN
jgi:transcriptional regulator with XRE-family HTH domain